MSLSVFIERRVLCTRQARRQTKMRLPVIVKDSSSLKILSYLENTLGNVALRLIVFLSAPPCCDVSAIQAGAHAASAVRLARSAGERWRRHSLARIWEKTDALPAVPAGDRESCDIVLRLGHSIEPSLIEAFPDVINLAAAEHLPHVIKTPANPCWTGGRDRVWECA